MDEKVVEIMDSNGFRSTLQTNKYLCDFLCVQSLGKSIYATPRLQKKTSSSCGKFALAYLFFRTRCGRSLCKFAQAFGYNLDVNEERIDSFFGVLEK